MDGQRTEKKRLMRSQCQASTPKTIYQTEERKILVTKMTGSLKTEQVTGKYGAF